MAIPLTARSCPSAPLWCQCLLLQSPLQSQLVAPLKREIPLSTRQISIPPIRMLHTLTSLLLLVILALTLSFCSHWIPTHHPQMCTLVTPQTNQPLTKTSPQTNSTASLITVNSAPTPTLVEPLRIHALSKGGESCPSMGEFANLKKRKHSKVLPPTPHFLNKVHIDTIYGDITSKLSF